MSVKWGELTVLVRIRAGLCAALIIIVLVGCAAQMSSQQVGREWGASVAAAVRPHIKYTASKALPEAPAEFIIWLSPQGVLLDKTMFNSSGDAQWDMAASMALRSVDRFPPEPEGAMPHEAVVSISPKFITAAGLRAPRSDSVAVGGPSYARKVAAAIRPHVAYPDAAKISGNPGAEFEVRLRPDGFITSIVLIRSSGFPGWDDAARIGLVKTEKLPVGLEGKVPPLIVIVLRPKV